MRSQTTNIMQRVNPMNRANIAPLTNIGMPGTIAIKRNEVNNPHTINSMTPMPIAQTAVSFMSILLVRFPLNHYTGAAEHVFREVCDGNDID